LDENICDVTNYVVWSALRMKQSQCWVVAFDLHQSASKCSKHEMCERNKEQ